MNRRGFFKTAGAATATSLALGFPLAAHAKKSAVCSLPSGVSVDVQWLGGATMTISFDGVTLLTDPAFGVGEKALMMPDPNSALDMSQTLKLTPIPRFTPLPPIDLSKVSMVLVSHMHPDHFDRAAEQALPKDLKIIAHPDDLKALQEKDFQNAQGLAWGDTQQVKTANGTISITAIRATHSPKNQVMQFLGQGSGYFFTFQKGSFSKTLYWTGDTFPTPQVLEQVKSLGEIDILIPHAGNVGAAGTLGQISMGAVEVTQMAEELKPQHILPIHHSTYALYREPAWKLAEALASSSANLDLVSEGVTLSYS
ncbi:MBL fold metallo-hydrolase [Flexibacterium corallicola]|uniref:MBL fold metallo-hydrolase n=1 Tax=Flexibacterium corallicola TaxID=3037259 RepID=UPI00286EC044|nr:MBL fold metallo-hydrolase [Pseudovibrio sp. M1P-2-3]